MWGIDTFGVADGDSTRMYASEFTLAYDLRTDANGCLQLWDSHVLEQSMSAISPESRTVALDVFQTYVAKWMEGRLLRNTVLVNEVAAGEELFRLQSAIVQAPTNTGLTSVNLQSDMRPLKSSDSDMLMLVALSRKETHVGSRNQSTSDSYVEQPRLARFSPTDGRWLALASEPVETDDPELQAQFTCD